ncbi:MAG: toll/interleukin-1 receptor domain-containing protein [Armatimonadetes bacterium]|nr:toll/interleukin-1 receptor domain-containing protein [Armatimonadota bacterium]
MEDRIRASTVVVVVLSTASARSDYVRKEIHFGQEAGKLIIPVLLRATEAPLPLADLQWVDAREGRDPLAGLVAGLRGETSPALRAPEVLPQPPKPLELTLTIERSDDDLVANVAFPEEGLRAGPIRFTPPIKSSGLDELRWYLEQYPRWPVGPDVGRAERLESRLKDWGVALFQVLFGTVDASRLWQQFRGESRRLTRMPLLTLDATDPDALRLPWELLADEEGHLFALGISLRRRVQKVQAAQRVTFGLPIRILMIVARPEDSRTPFIDPRASPQAVLKAVELLGTENVVIEFLHPPTLQALDERLRDDKQPLVHVVHFDGTAFT